MYGKTLFCLLRAPLDDSWQARKVGAFASHVAISFTFGCLSHQCPPPRASHLAARCVLMHCSTTYLQINIFLHSLHARYVSHKDITLPAVVFYLSAQTHHTSHDSVSIASHVFSGSF